MVRSMDNHDNDNWARTCMPFVLRRYRDAAGLTQQQSADRLGIAKSYVSSLELGYRALHLNMLVKMRQAFGVRPGEPLKP